MESIQSHRITCLRRITDNKTVKPLVISLDGKSEVTVGRAGDCTVQLGLGSNAVMLSRKHAVLTKEGEAWSITDCKSLNGVYVNDTRLKPMEPCVLKEKDVVQFGIPTSLGTPAEFVWSFCTALKVRKIKAGSSQPPPVASTSAKDSRVLLENINQKRKCLDNSNSPVKRLKQNDAAPPSATNEYQQKMEAVQKLAEERLKEQERHLEEMKKLLAEKEQAQEEMLEQLQTREKELQEEMHRKQAEHEQEQKRKEAELRNEYENRLQVQETRLMRRLAFEKTQLEEERQQLEIQLAGEMEKQHGEQEQKLQIDLEAEKAKLTAIIEQKDARQKMLEAQLNETRTERMKAEEGALVVREDILCNFADLMETELQCSICNELFIQATSLNCSHSFCALCIEQWMEVKRECPVCRSPITSHLRSIVFDSYIDKMLEHFNDDKKNDRKDLVIERKELQAKREADRAVLLNAGTAALAARRGRRNARGRAGTTRGRARGARNRTTPATVPARVTTRATAATAVTAAATNILRPVVRQEAAPIVVSSSDSEEEVDLRLSPSYFEHFYNNSDSDSESSVEGTGDAYFGGYGSCYTCGRRGHWATSCPF